MSDKIFSEKQEKVKSWRLLEIDKILKSGQKATASGIAKELGVSSRTILRDLDYLRDMYQAPIEYDANRKTFYYSQSNFYIESVPLTEGELFTIGLFDQLLDQYRNTPLENDLRNIFRKIVSCLPNSITVDSCFLENNVTYIPDQLGIIEKDTFTVIFKALQSCTTLQFEYRPLQKTSYMTRLLDPYHAVCQKGNWYIIGFCHDKNEVRVFNFSRMKNVVMTKDNFKVPSDFKPESFFDKEVGIWLSSKKEYEVKLLISKEIGTYAIDKRWHSNQVVKQNEDGSVLVSFKTSQLPEIKRWVLGQGATVEVLEPLELKNDILKEVNGILSLYNK